MPEPDNTITKIMREECKICDKPDEIVYRLNKAEIDIVNLHDRFSVTKKEIFAEMKANKEETNKKFERLNIYVISTLTTALISLIVLLFKIR